MKDKNIEPDESKFIGKAKLTRQGQVTLPLEGRKDLGISPESEVYWYRVNNCLIVIKDIMNPRDLVNYLLKKKK